MVSGLVEQQRLYNCVAITAPWFSPLINEGYAEMEIWMYYLPVYTNFNNTLLVDMEYKYTSISTQDGLYWKKGLSLSMKGLLLIHMKELFPFSLVELILSLLSFYSLHSKLTIYAEISSD